MNTKIIFTIGKHESTDATWHLKEFLQKVMDDLKFEKITMGYKIEDDSIDLIFTLEQHYIIKKEGI